MFSFFSNSIEFDGIITFPKCDNCAEFGINRLIFMGDISLHIEIPYVEGIVFDETATGLYFVAHEDGEDLVGADGVVEDYL